MHARLSFLLSCSKTSTRGVTSSYDTGAGKKHGETSAQSYIRKIKAIATEEDNKRTDDALPPPYSGRLADDAIQTGAVNKATKTMDPMQPS
jgi:hypothetical protein